MNFSYGIKIGFAYYANHKDGKRHPFLVFQDAEDKRTTLWRITSKYLTKSNYYQKRYFPLFHWYSYGLEKPSYVDIGSQLNLTMDQYNSLTISKRPALSYLTKSDQIQFIEFINKLK